MAYLFLVRSHERYLGLSVGVSEQVVEMTAEYLRRKEDAKFEDAFAELS